MKTQTKNKTQAGDVCFHIGAYRLSKVALVLGLFFLIPSASAQVVKGVNVEALASAIGRAENSKTKPYGILKDYCRPGDPDGQCRKGCVQTIQKRLKLWTGKEDFIFFLGQTYAPTSGATNDPHGLNRNWTRLVTHFYEKEISL